MIRIRMIFRRSTTKTSPVSEACRFCKQEFSNTQAVRAHLKGCVVYRNRRAGETAGTGSPIMPGRPGPPGLPGLLYPGNSEAPGPRDREGKTPDEFDPVR